MTKIAFAPIAIIAVMVFTWVIAAWATYTDGPKDDYNYEDDHVSAPPHAGSDKTDSGRAA